MGRAPCCDKNGLKKGPWTPEEDQKLINYIQTHGPANWRSLPKIAGTSIFLVYSSKHLEIVLVLFSHQVNKLVSSIQACKDVARVADFDGLIT